MENYSLLMGDSSVDEDGGGVDGDAFQGHFPVRRRAGTETPVPQILARWRRLGRFPLLKGPVSRVLLGNALRLGLRVDGILQADTRHRFTDKRESDLPRFGALDENLQGVISSLEAFASQFTSLEADKARLQKEVKSSSSKLDGAVKIAAEARQEVDSLKEELGKLKEKLKEEEASRLTAEARAAEKDELLRQSSLALLESANIPADALDKVPNNSPANGVSMTLASHQLTRELLEKGKGAMARMHSMIFPKINQDKTLGQLIDAFAVDTKEVIEVFPVPSFVDDSSGALPEDDRVQRMKDRITQLEKDLHSTYALAAIIKKKGEIAADVERYALTELHKATESLNSNLLTIANAVGDLETLYPKVLLPANIIVDKLEKDSKQAGEIDNLTVSLGQSTLVVLCRFHVGAGIHGVAPHYIPPPSTFDVLLGSSWFDKPWFLSEGKLADEQDKSHSEDPC
ncbi:hypothetical protein QYE76_025655 [Lolium multiflorum]|uniref:Uncharacterized protein n=1 Tax=Lolium multiflorum TaxID=4521 RepID=A0AAD8REH5_LOLMU|nr:hypothetical protein QYE76_025655 [Lolium multiflorum]